MAAKVDENKLYSVAEVAHRLRVGQETVRRMLRAGRIPATRTDGAGGSGPYRVKGSEIIEFLR